MSRAGLLAGAVISFAREETFGSVSPANSALLDVSELNFICPTMLRAPVGAAISALVQEVYDPEVTRSAGGESVPETSGPFNGEDQEYSVKGPLKITIPLRTPGDEHIDTTILDMLLGSCMKATLHAPDTTVAILALVSAYKLEVYHAAIGSFEAGDVVQYRKADGTPRYNRVVYVDGGAFEVWFDEDFDGGVDITKPLRLCNTYYVSFGVPDVSTSLAFKIQDANRTIIGVGARVNGWAIDLSGKDNITPEMSFDLDTTDGTLEDADDLPSDTHLGIADGAAKATKWKVSPSTYGGNRAGSQLAGGVSPIPLRSVAVAATFKLRPAGGGNGVRTGLGNHDITDAMLGITGSADEDSDLRGSLKGREVFAVSIAFNGGDAPGRGVVVVVPAACVKKDIPPKVEDAGTSVDLEFRASDRARSVVITDTEKARSPFYIAFPS